MTRAGARQDALWRQFVDEVRASPTRPFEEQWARFNEIYSGRSPVDGPPRVWEPGAIDRSNLGAASREWGFDSYADLHRWSVTEREAFWEAVIARLGIVFRKSPDKVLGAPNDPLHPNWLPGAQFNCVDSCFIANPDKAAVISGREGREERSTTTYRELERLVNRVARGLGEHGFREGERIALYMPMTVECVAAYLGIIRAGGVVISIADSFAASELERRLRIGEAQGVITMDAYVRGGKEVRLYEKVVEAGAPRAIVVHGTNEPTALRAGDMRWDVLLSRSDVFASVPGDPYSVINVLFSSGTTGEPKAIPWTQLTPLKCAMDGHFHQDITPGNRVAWPTNVGWMMGPWLIFAALINGSAIALYEGAPNGAGFVDFVRDCRVSVLGTVPSLVRAWRSAGVVSESHFEAVRVFSSTGEPSNLEDYLWLMSRTGYRAPVIEYCGGTEIGGGYVTGTVVQPASPATFTTPSLGLDFVILDDAARPAAVGEAGELYLLPPSIGLSEALLNQDHDRVYYEGCPLGPGGARLRRHGDRFTALAGGFYQARGRADDTMNLGGVKVSSLELEQVLDEHPAVHESAAVAVQSRGDSSDRLVVYVVTERNADAPALKQTLSALIAARLNPLFKIDDVVAVERLPRTASNKLMRRALRDRYITERSAP